MFYLFIQNSQSWVIINVLTSAWSQAHTFGFFALASPSTLPPYPRALSSAHARETAWEWLFRDRGVGPLRPKTELQEFAMSAMLAMAYWIREEERSLRKKRPIESDQDPGLPGSVRTATDLSCYQSNDWIPQNITDPSMITQKQNSFNFRRSDRFMLNLIL